MESNFTILKSREKEGVGESFRICGDMYGIYDKIFKDMSIKHKQDDNFVTNFDVEDIIRYKNALILYRQETGDECLFIYKKAYWQDGTIDTKMYSLRDNDSRNIRDLSKFWEILDNIIL